MKKILIGLFTFWACAAQAQIVGTLPFQLQNGTTADATQVMADFNKILNDVNINAAKNGVNTDITALTALVTPITPVQGGSSVYFASTSGGTANAQTVAAPSPTGFTLSVGKRITFIAGFTNTAALQLNVNTTGLTNVFKPTPSGPVALTGGEVVVGNYIEAVFNGTQFELYTDSLKQGWGPLTNLASAATTDLGTIASHNVNITGTTGITAFGSSAITGWPIYKLTFAGILTLTHNGTSLILPGAAGITTAANDTAEVVYLGSGNWRMTSYTRSAGTANVNPLLIQNYLSGLTMSPAGGSATMPVAAGVATDSTNVSTMLLPSAYTKTTASWAVGSGNGALDTGAIANATWYHFFLIQRLDTGVVDILFSLSATAPTMPTNYTLFRRFGSARTSGSAQWIKFIQFGDDFTWDVPVTDQFVTVAASTLYQLTNVPIGITVEANFTSTFTSTAAGAFITISSPLITAPAVGVPNGNLDYTVQTANQTSAGSLRIWTNTSSQIRAVANGVGTNAWAAVSRGWRDLRGKL